jgi:hypothetical protein
LTRLHPRWQYSIQAKPYTTIGAAILIFGQIFRLFVCALVSFVLYIPASAQNVKSPEFTLIALPDPQMYSEYSPEIFKQQASWIGAHRVDLNIKFVIGLGDNVNDGDSETQWKNASDAMALLDNSGIPYAMAIGNHDYLHSKPPTRSAPLFNKFFGKARYTGKPWYGSSTFPTGTSENFYVNLPIEGDKYLFLFLEYFPRHEAIAWAKTVLETYAASKVIVVTHALEGSDAFRNGRCDYNGPEAEGLETNYLDGEQMWSELISRYTNIFITLNGHVNGAARETDFGQNGNVVTQILADYQDDAEGGAGFLRILTFKPAQHRIVVSTYSPYTESYKTDEQNSFTVPYDNADLDPRFAGIRGRVRSNECESISGANVSYGIGQLHEWAFADVDGYFATPTTLGPGKYRVTINAPGFAPTTVPAQVRAGFTTPTRVYLAKAAKEFLMTVPAAQELRPGSSMVLPIAVKRIGGFAVPIRLSISGLPSGITALLSSATVIGSKGTSLTIKADPQLAPGKYMLRIIATAGTMSRISSLEVVVPPLAAPAH